LSGMRGTTGVGIVVGGLGGAILALLGAARSPAPPAAPTAAAPPTVAPIVPSQTVAAPVAEAPAPRASTSAGSVAAAEEPLLATSATASAAEASSAAPLASSKAAEAPLGSAPALELPRTREALLKAELYCDKRQDFDECSRAAAALEAGSAGPPDPEQAKRFRRIALTHLVAQCEVGSAHACFVIAAKYRAGTELAASPTRAEALEKRGLELCRLGRSAPECPREQ